ncbi:MAG: polymerase beta domain protein region protein [Berkelbacteria bacterium GW2011_GWA2_46_7]|uniref:Polymerase beta domain protein region protein n=1 Tax=Berkelbacteria bacterium GW2011_GWA2_46_7 TaxID=1618335 RepID=A0A0G1QHP2_9BACT|nr:MAG: polymerase beta domain protein region protein [Berkelbacteria bacterium GW2011_GWA2_46_7]
MSITQIQKGVAEAIREDPYGASIRSVSLFGSFLSGKNKSDSDVDLLFETRRIMSLFQIGGIHYRLEQKLGRKVDFIPKNSLDKYIKKGVLSEAKIIYTSAD